MHAVLCRAAFNEQAADNADAAEAEGSGGSSEEVDSSEPMETSEGEDEEEVPLLGGGGQSSPWHGSPAAVAGVVSNCVTVFILITLITPLWQASLHQHTTFFSQ